MNTKKLKFIRRLHLFGQVDSFDCIRNNQATSLDHQEIEIIFNSTKMPNNRRQIVTESPFLSG
jgi:hypothetical protein